MTKRTAPTWLLFSLAGMVWGSSFLLIKVGLTAFSPAQVAVGRLGFGALALGAIMLSRRVAPIRDWSALRHIAVVGFFLAGLPLLIWAWVGQFLPSGISAIFNATTPLLTLVLASIFLPNDRMTRTGIVGVLLGAFGLTLVVGPWQYVGEAELRGTTWAAYAGALAATSCYAIGFVYLRKTLRTSDFSPIAFSFAQISMGFIAVLVLALPSGLFAQVAFNWTALGAVLVLGAIGTGVAYIWNTMVVGAWGPVRASMVTYVTPVVGVLLGIALLGERFSWNEPVGMVVLFTGIALAQGVIPVRRGR
ncbi:MAG TPA: DMT family transporter [Microbacteriaceae bacterium]|nr:DMT family transporter [Microbacteriaceae bacterium]